MSLVSFGTSLLGYNMFQGEKQDMKLDSSHKLCRTTLSPLVVFLRSPPTSHNCGLKMVQATIPLLGLLAALARLSTASTSFSYPYSSTQTFSETLTPNSTCLGLYEGEQTSFACQCATTENTSSFRLCSPIDSTTAALFCASNTNKESCYAAACPSGSCAPLPITGTTMLETDCGSDLALGFGPTGKCGCFNSTTSFTPCSNYISDNTTQSAVCISESLTARDGVQGGYAAFCDSRPVPGGALILTLPNQTLDANQTVGNATPSNYNSTVAAIADQGAVAAAVAVLTELPANFTRVYGSRTAVHRSFSTGSGRASPPPRSSMMRSAVSSSIVRVTRTSLSRASSSRAPLSSFIPPSIIQDPTSGQPSSAVATDLPTPNATVTTVFSTRTVTDIVTLSSGVSTKTLRTPVPRRCIQYRFAFSAKCCPASGLGLKRRSHSRKLARKHDVVLTQFLETTVTETETRVVPSATATSSAAAPTQTSCKVQTELEVVRCPAINAQKTQRGFISTIEGYKRKTTTPIIIDCGKGRQYLY